MNSGPYKIYHENGNIKEEGVTENNQLNGKIAFYSEDGKLEETGTYVNGKVDGEYFHYDKVGKLVKKQIYKNGNLINTEEFQKEEGEKNESERVKN